MAQGSCPYYGPGGVAPTCPKLFASRPKSAMSAVSLPSKSARPSYSGSPDDLPNVTRRMLKSEISTTLLSSASPTFNVPISTLIVDAPVKFTRPDLARYCGPLTHQVYSPKGSEPTCTAKKPVELVVRSRSEERRVGK